MPLRSFATSSPGIFSGLTNRLSSALEERKAAAAEDKFGGMVRDMLSSSKWTLEQQRAMLRDAAADAGLSGWKSWMPGISSQAGAEELRRMLALLDALTPEERVNAELIDRDARLRVAGASKCSVADVNFVLKQFTGAQMVHRWLHERRAKGKPMPITQAEMTRYMAADKPTPDPALRHKPRRR